MKKIQFPLILIGMLLLAASCGNTGKKEREGKLGDMKVQLEKLTNQRDKLDKQIAALETEIQKLDTTASAQELELVALQLVEKEPFTHYLELTGKIGNQNVSYITPTGQPGQIEAIYVKEGERVSKGELVLKLDNTVAMQQVNAIKQQKNSIEAQLELAKSVYERQKNLWENNIGTEVQLLQAKTNVETLQGQLKAVKAQVQTALTQAKQSNVYSNVNGVVDEVTAHVGETFNGNPLSGGYIKIVNQSDLRVQVNIPENYAGDIHEGSPVEVQYAGGTESFEGKITFLSRAIDPSTRSFTAEIRVPSKTHLRPNQMVHVKIMDYKAPESITIPLNTVQNDEEGKYVMIAVKENGRLEARKKHVLLGKLYQDEIEILQGLEVGDKVITQGFQGIFEGQELKTNNS